jgi:hypothetical protein
MAGSTAPIKTRYRHFVLSGEICIFFRLRYHTVHPSSAIIFHHIFKRLRQLSNGTETGEFGAVIGLSVNGLLLDRDILVIVTGHMHVPP